MSAPNLQEPTDDGPLAQAAIARWRQASELTVPKFPFDVPPQGAPCNTEHFPSVGGRLAAELQGAPVLDPKITSVLKEHDAMLDRLVEKSKAEHPDPAPEV